MSLYLIRVGLWAIAIVLLFAAAGIDLRERIIPNRLVALVAANGLLLGLVSRPEWIWISLLAAVAVFVGLGFLAHFRLIGGGDVKLISAVTLLVPPELIGLLLLSIALVGGVISCGYLAAYYVFKRQRAHKMKRAATAYRLGKFPQLLRSERARILTATSVPYGAAVLGGVA
ncbi:MAG: A24 family peptidase, partial [Candidatus Binatia bacterium]